jgi:predicted Zn-dependent protease
MSRDSAGTLRVHELGHALGLCHKPDGSESAMWKAASVKDVPTAVDQANYKKQWG